MSSLRFCKIYDKLPQETRDILVQDHLLPLLDTLPKARSQKITAAATRYQNRLLKIPELDLRSKRKEVSGLLDDLQRDAKKSAMKERLNLDEILYEIIDSLTGWLQNVWSNAFEHHVRYSRVHDCLLFTASILERVESLRGFCKCSHSSMYIPLLFKNKHGRKIKSFHVNGAPNLDRVLLWLWREVFITMLAYGSEKEEEDISLMLQDISSIFGWHSLRRIVTGGQIVEDSDDEDAEYSSSEGEEDDDENYEDDDGDEAYEDVEENTCTDLGCLFHEKHWPLEVSRQTPRLRALVQENLMNQFKQEPSVAVYVCTISVADDPEETELDLIEHLEQVSIAGPESFAAALEIHTLRSDPLTIIELLDSHYHLLRPRDTLALQKAVRCLSENPIFHWRALKILEKELMDNARTIKAAILPCFSKIDQPEHRKEIAAIMDIPPGAPGRTTRLAAWLEAVVTPIQAPHPIAFAAFMMGLHIGPEEADNEDPLGLMDLDEDPDLEDLKEEFRPSLKPRFEGWKDLAYTIKGGNSLLLKCYKEIVEIMPFLKGNDVVDEMISRLSSRPSKAHICDALGALLSFAKAQKRKLQKKEAVADKAPKKPKPVPEKQAIPPGSWRGGMEDVD